MASKCLDKCRNPSTRSVSKDQNVWLVGEILDSIKGCKLPSNRQVLGRFFYFHLNDKQTIQDSAAATIKEVFTFWEKARIPTKYECDAIKQIRKFHTLWQGLKKSASRKTETQKKHEKAFIDTLDDLFDVAHVDALNLIKIAEDRAFLLAQREKGRRGTMSCIDMVLFKKEEKRRHQYNLEESRRNKEAKRAIEEKTTEEFYSSSEESGADESKDSETDNVEVDPIPRPKRKKISQIVTPELASALDRTKISDRNATYVLSAAAQLFGCNIEDIAVNRESIRKARRQHGEDISAEIRHSFNPAVPLTVHWDGKMLPALTGNELVERLAVLVSGDGVMKLLGVPKLEKGSGEEQAHAVFTLLQAWNVADRVNLMSFDTTTSNTGLKSGACVLLEKKLNKDLLSLACRHHILELIVAKLFDQLLGPSSGPNIKLFKRFCDSWDSIDQNAYESGLKEECIASELQPLKEELLTFTSLQLSVHHPRDDYKELLQLAQLFLGAEPPPGFNFHRPGAYHRARWMAKLIYSLKVYLFRSQFKMTAYELSGLRTYNVFVVRLYLRAWYTCPCSASAPRNDLVFLKELIKYKKTNKTVAEVAIKSFMNHLWYLSESLVGLAFFDPEVPTEMKAAMVEALKRIPLDDPPRRVNIAENLVPEKELSDFVSNNSRKLFSALDISEDFLTEDPGSWDTNNDFFEGKHKIDHLKVVNDAAERGVALIQSFNGVLSNQEEQKQFLLQVVEKHRRDFPNTDKSTLLKGLHKF